MKNIYLIVLLFFVKYSYSQKVIPCFYSDNKDSCVCIEKKRLQSFVYLQTKTGKLFNITPSHLKHFTFVAYSDSSIVLKNKNNTIYTYDTRRKTWEIKKPHLRGHDNEKELGP